MRQLFRVAMVVLAAGALRAQSSPAPAAPEPPLLGALAPPNIAKPRPKPPFDMIRSLLVKAVSRMLRV